MFDISFVYLVIFLMMFCCGVGVFFSAVWNMFKFMHFHKIKGIKVFNESNTEEFTHIQYNVNGQIHDKLFDTDLVNGSLYYNKKNPDEIVNIHFELSDLYALIACTVLFAVLFEIFEYII